MRRNWIIAAAVLATLPLAACGGDGGTGINPTPPPPTTDPSPPYQPQPFVCPDGMPTYKCEQLKKLHDPDRVDLPPSPQ